MASRGIGIDLSVPLSESLKAALLLRLEAQTEKTSTCWLWRGWFRNGRHGAISVRDRPVWIHQLSYAIHHGPIPRGQVVRHDCDVPNCWRPEHLLLGRQLDNVADMWARGRAKKPPRMVGTANHNARLTDEQVAEIRHRWATDPCDQRALAREYRCSQSTIWRLVHDQVRALA
jgi:hypothetical protein